MTKAKSKTKAAARPTMRKTGKPKSRVRSTPASLKTPAKPDTKHTRIVAMLRSPGGATIAAIITATEWQKHSVRGFLAGVVRKKLGLNLISEVTDKGRVYRIKDSKGSSAAAVRRHVHDQPEETEGRPAAHALSEHLLQGPGLLLLMEKLLEVRGLKTHFSTDRGLFRAVDGISFSVPRGRTVGLVGESGCGKSVTSLSVMGLVPSPPGKVEAEAVMFANRDVLTLSADERRKLRGSKMSMIFQEPMTSLNPVHTIGQQIVEAILAHTDVSPQAAKKRAIEMLELVRIPSAIQRIDDYPHRLSGGMRQRVMIAMALSCEPALLIADEPTTALDVTIQAQILDLLQDLQRRLGMAVLIITHDLGVIAEVADDVLVMYAGKIVESASVDALFADPQHPYTIGLLGSIPRLDIERERLATIEGTVPSPNRQPKGCRFSPRCPFADRRCHEEPPPLRDIGAGHRVACWKAPVEGAVAA